jgi:cytochrome c-type biogenesis protein CcmH/NrfG
MRRVCLLLAVVLAGCGTVAANRKSPSEPNVPFMAQRPGQCGPAALAMLAQYYGHIVTQDEIADEIYLPDIYGTLTSELTAYAGRFGLWVRSYRGSLADVREKLHHRVPLIVLGKLGNRYHYFVLLRYDEATGTLIVHSDTRPNLAMRREDFMRWWNRAGNWTLLVCPPDKVSWRLSADECNDLGLHFERTGDLARAAGHYRRASELRPSNSYFHFNLGNAMMKQGLNREAAAAFAQAIRVETENADAMNNLAWTWHELDANLEEAAALCRKACLLRPGKRAYYLDTLGCVLLKGGDVTGAVNAFQEALESTTPQQAALRQAISDRLAAARNRSP